MRRIDLISCLLLAAPLAAQGPETAKVISRPVERATHVPGEFLPYQSVELHARVNSFVREVLVDRGSVVRKNQLLVSLDAPELVAQLAEAESKLRALEAQKAQAEAKLLASENTYERLKAASATPGVIAGHDLLLAQKDADAARALVRAQDGAILAAQASVNVFKEMEGFLRVTAPFDGVVTERLVHPGALVGPAGKPLLTIEDVGALRLVAAVPETAVAGLQTGVKVSFTVPAHAGSTFNGTVARIPRSLDPKTRTMPVELDVPNARGLLAPGMYAELRWPARRPGNSLLVPPSSIVTTTERSFVIRVRGGKAEWVDVRRIGPAGDLVEVNGPLSEGDVILRRGSDEIREGTELRAFK